MKLSKFVVALMASTASAVNSITLETEKDVMDRFERVKGRFGFQDRLILKETLEEDECPPCFNCNLPNFECSQFSQCNTFTGMCECRDGYGGMDCSDALCGGLSDGNNKRPKKKLNETCECRPGWLGINCNLCTEDSVCDSFLPEGLKGTCYKTGVLINNFHQMCDVTNKKIISILKGQKPQATFSCNKTAGECDFQFWIDQKESFYCDLTKCEYNYDIDKNTTRYQCKDMACKCIPDRMLCGEAGSIDISEFLTETIRGPGEFTCDVKERACRFSEPSMNDLIQSVFGDPYITLKCKSGECVHQSEIPGFDIPKKSRLTMGNAIVIVGVTIVCFLVLLASINSIRKTPLFLSAPQSDVGADSTALSENFTPTSLAFENVSYTIPNGLKVLKDVFGLVHPRECLAIMGGSGAGKTTLLDILAGKNKDGTVQANITVNGAKLDPRDFKKLIGFVDQEDHLIPTLTVYETVLNSALLRLPRSMSLRAKQARVIEVLNELRILGIKDREIGSDFERGISGGEKRRVSIACELVTSPSILFLDEPTSGLDAYNARNVVECLVKLSRDFERTIVFTIHQPRSNIVSLFDKLVLLSEGDLVYSGDMMKCNGFFAKNGFKCPVGYNIADYLIDLTANKNSTQAPAQDLEGLPAEAASTDVHAVDQTENFDLTREWEHYATHRNDFFGAADSERGNTEMTAKLNQLFAESVYASDLKDEIKGIEGSSSEFDFSDNPKASIGMQIGILSSRTFKNLYRNPKLLLSHYILSILVGAFCGYLYYDVQNDISGFQNRLGLFFFVLALFGFSALTGLHSFSAERIIFIRERANNYYHPFSYYISKIVCDVIPLRVFPPIILTSIVYPLVGLSGENNGFLKTIMVLVLFNLSVAIEVLIVGILIKDPGTSTMIGVLVLLFSLLFAGLFINGDELQAAIKWLQWISVFHYAYEALSINEVKDLILREKKYGLSIEVPGAVILSSFGFDVGAFWKDTYSLTISILVFLTLGYTFLHFFAYEKR